MNTFKNFLASARGATAIEYAMIAGMVSIAVVAVLLLIGGNLQARFQAVVDAFGS